AGKTPADWKTGVIVPVFKRGDHKECSNYRGITFLSLPGKVYAKVLERKCREILDLKIQEEQCGLRPCRSTSDHIFALRQIVEKSWEYAQPVYVCFVDLEKAHDRIPRNCLWTCLGTYEIYVQVPKAIQSLYSGSWCCVRINGVKSKPFNLRPGLRQGCVLSSLLLCCVDTIFRSSQGDEGIGGSVCNPVLQVALIAESQKLQALLSTYGITCQTPRQVEPVQIWPSSQLVKVFEGLGNNSRLGLTGRPPRPIGALGTSKIYRVLGETVLCYPLLFDVSDFYLSSDPAVLIDDIKRDLLFVARRWQLAGRPTYCVLLTEPLVVGEHFASILDLLVDMKNGRCNNVRVRLGRVQNLLSAGCWEHLDFVPQNAELSFKVESLKEAEGISDISSLSNLRESECMLIFDQDFDIEPYQKKPTEDLLLALQSAPSSAFFTKSKLLHLLLNRHGMDFKIDDEQELIIALGHFASVEPELFSGMLKIRIGWLIHAMNLQLNYEHDRVGHRSVNDLSPTEIKQELHDLFAMKHFSRLSALQQRQLNGCLNRVPPDFYDQVWRILERTPEGIIVAGHHLPQQPTLSDMTEYELNFALTIEELLSRPKLPEYRQVMVELIQIAFEAFCKDSSIQDTTDMTPFLKLKPQVRAGTSTYLAKV
ncbi:unnamed protein product, partial [Soboliphyme baturini]|uniref:Phosphorylase b kinase regulatory subunit n=1 Tax=Soboliphyme baturini TaxID=241478 RepID=A0A183IK50_9BILA